MTGLDDRRLAEDLGAAGPDAAPPRPPILRGGPLARLVHGVLGGLILVWVAVQGGPGLAAVLVVTQVLFGLVVSLVARSGIRRRLDTARAAHPGTGVVVASFAGVGGIAWGRWARGAGVRVPPRAGFSSLLVGDADGLEQRVLHDGARLHRWSWDEVELSRAPDPDRPRPAPRDRAGGAGAHPAGAAAGAAHQGGARPAPALRRDDEAAGRLVVGLHPGRRRRGDRHPARCRGGVRCRRRAGGRAVPPPVLVAAMG